MPELTSRQRAHLRSLAHPLKAILQIGRDGVSDALVQSVEDAFHTRELFKVRVLDTAPGPARDLAPELAARLPGAHVVTVIGHTIVLYRPHPETPEIRLPG